MIELRKILESLQSSEDDRDQIYKQSYSGVGSRLKEHLKSKDIEIYTGKVRELVLREQDMFMVHTDRLTAFDRYIATVPYKGTILCHIANFWLKRAEEIVPTHLIGMPHSRILRTKKLQPFKIEVIVRGYLAGSMARAYEKGIRSFCGESLPDGLQNYQALPTPIITPTTKAAVFEHDEDTNAEELVKNGICSEAQWNQISSLALKVFQMGQQIYKEHNWILVDSKYEFGADQSGKIYLIDEVHTPDSSRLWLADTYQSNLDKNLSPKMFDKEIIRQDLLSKGFSGTGEVPRVEPQKLVSLSLTYLNVAEELLGEPILVDEMGPSTDEVLLNLL